MTDPREVLRPSGPEPALDLQAVHARAGQLSRRRRVAVAGGGAGVLVAVLALSGVALQHSAGEELLRPPVAATGTPLSPQPPPVAPTPGPTPTAGAGRSGAPGTTAASPSGSPRATRPPTTAPRSTPPTTTAPGTAAPTTPPAPTPAFVADTGPDTGVASGGQLSLVGIRAARQDGFDRVVYEFSGPAGAVPGWRVEYVEQAVADPSGLPVQVRGAAVLQVVLREVAPGYTGGRLSPTGTALLSDVVPSSTFEGVSQSFLGLTARAPFRVTQLANPPRVVVDVLAP
jgi:hypothetical protein